MTTTLQDALPLIALGGTWLVILAFWGGFLDWQRAKFAFFSRLLSDKPRGL